MNTNAAVDLKTADGKKLGARNELARQKRVRAFELCKQGKPSKEVVDIIKGEFGTTLGPADISVIQLAVEKNVSLETVSNNTCDKLREDLRGLKRITMNGVQKVVAVNSPEAKQFSQAQAQGKRGLELKKAMETKKPDAKKKNVVAMKDATPSPKVEARRKSQRSARAKVMRKLDERAIGLSELKARVKGPTQGVPIAVMNAVKQMVKTMQPYNYSGITIDRRNGKNVIALRTEKTDIFDL